MAKIRITKEEQPSRPKKVLIKVSKPEVEKDKEIKGPIGFLNSYYNSPLFAQRIKMNNPSSATIEYLQGLAQAQRGAELYNPKVVDIREGGSHAVGVEKVIGQWGDAKKIKTSTPTVFLDKTQAKDGKMDLFNDVLPHEYSHNTRRLSSNDEASIAQLNKNPKVYERFSSSIPSRDDKANSFSRYLQTAYPGGSHDYQPTEQYADLNSLRWLMHKRGIYDTRKRQMTVEDINKAINDPYIKQQFTFKRLLKLFKPEDLVKLNNTVALNESDNKSNDTA